MLFNLNKLLMKGLQNIFFPVLKEIVEKTGLSINSIKNKTPKYLKLVYVIGGVRGSKSHKYDYANSKLL